MADQKKKTFSSKRKIEFIEVDKQDYVIVAMSGTKTEEYRETLQKRFQSDPNDPTKQRMVSVAGTYKDLFSRCMYKVMPGSDRVPCDGSEADLWEDEVCSEVFALCQRVCGLTDDAEDDAKKD